MSKPLRKIDVDGLRIGMYVSRLDRPWLETPFLFQGFFIRGSSEIEDLRRYCDFVEIDIEESNPGIGAGAARPAQIGRDHRKASRRRGSKRSIWQRLRGLFSRQPDTSHHEPRPGEFYQDTASTSDELSVAGEIHMLALSKLSQTLDRIREGASVSLPELETVTGTMVDSVLRNSTALALLARLQEKSEYTGSHSVESSIWALVFGRHLGMDKESLAAVGLGGLLMDVGKTRMPAKLLNKKGSLTEVERTYLRTHVEQGIEIVRESSDVDRRVMDMISAHHERYDGSGYPRGWKANQIPVFARIGGIVDSYTAMTNDRPYAQAMSSFDAMRELKALSDKHFQAEMVEQFIQAVGIFPAGTLVELNTGEIAIVLKEHSSSRLQPEVAIVLDRDKQPVQDLKLVDLIEQSGSTPTVWIERGVEPGVYAVDPKKYFL